MRKNLDNLTKRTLTAILAAAMMTVSVPTDIIYADPVYEEIGGGADITGNEASESDSEESEEISDIIVINEEESDEYDMDYAEDNTDEISEDIWDNSEAFYDEAFGTIDIDFEAPYTSGGEEVQATIPSAYDSRDYIAVTDVKNQGRLNTCWAFASMAVAEANTVKKNIASDPDYSERHLNYFSYNYKEINDPLGNTLGDYVEVHPGQGSNIYKFGGNTNWTSWNLVNWVGGADESEYPYDKDNDMSDLENNTETCFDDVIHVQNTRFINEGQTDEIKKAIMEYGAVSMDFYSDSQYLNHDAYYCDVRMGDNGAKKANHSVAIVGWDDSFSKTNFAKQPSADGAWLAKNSWGTEFGNDGYCWISYFDKNIKQVVALEVEDVNTYDNNYYYDGATYHEYDSFGGASTTIYSNVFTAKSPQECDYETLSAVGIGIYSPNTHYRVQIYLNPTKESGYIPNTGTPVFDEPIEGDTTNAGFYTINLPENVVLGRGDKFAVAIEVPQSTKVFYDRIYGNSSMEFQSATNPGESFYGFESTSGSGYVWTDMNSTNRCFRIHAYTSDGNAGTAKDIATECDAVLVDGNKYVYSGKDIRPEVKVTCGGKVLKENIDYTVNYIVDPDDTGVGTRKYIVKITGVREYTGTVELKYEIEAFNIAAPDAKAKVEAAIASISYKGEEIKPAVSSVRIVMNNVNVTLKKDVDYTITYENNINAANANPVDENSPRIVVKGIGNYTGTVIKAFTINKKQISDYDVRMSGLDSSYVYTGKKIEPKPTYTYNKKNLVVGEDYIIDYRNNKDVALSSDPTIPPTIVIAGKGNFYGSREEKFTITRCPIKDNPKVDVTFKNGETYTYTGRGIEPEIQIINDGTVLTRDTDFTVKYYNNVRVKNYDAYADITGIGNYSDTVRKYFNIVSAPIDDKSKIKVELAKTEFTYTGSMIMPEVIVTDLESGMIIPRDKYNVNYINAIEVADPYSPAPPTVIVSGLNKEYTGSVELKFTIKRINMEDVKVKLDKTEYIYSGYDNCPVPTLTVDVGGAKTYTLIEGYDYYVSYKNNIDAGLATDANPPSVVIRAIDNGNFEGTIEIPFSIKIGLVLDETLIVDFLDKKEVIDNIPAYEWNGAEIRPNLTVSRKYKGEQKKELVRNEDFSMTFKNNVNVSETGTAILTITGIGLYSGTVDVPFKIKPTSINGGTRGVAEVILGIDTYNFTGTEHNPITRVIIDGETLKEGRDYEVFFQNNINAGNADDENGPKVKVIGKGNYSDAVYAGYTIKHTDVNSVVIKLESKSMTLTSYDELISGSIYPDITVTDKNNALFEAKGHVLDDTCYTVEAVDESNKKVGIAKYRIKGTGNYSGEKEILFTIAGVDVSKVSFASIEDQYIVFDETGAAVPLEPAVSAISGTISGKSYPIPKKDPDNGFDLYYINNDKSGTASALVVGRGMYTGSKIISFKILNRAINGDGITVNVSPSAVEFNSKPAVLDSITVTDKSRANGILYTYQLVEGKDYKVTYSKNTKAGKALVSITGMGNYRGSVNKNFDILKAPINDERVTITATDMTYNDGKELRPSVTVTYTYPDGRSVKLSPSDYTVSYKNNISISKPGNPARITIKGTGKGNFDTGTCSTGEFRIKDKAHTLSLGTITFDKIKDAEFMGTPIEPDFDVYLKSTRDSLVKYDGYNEDSADYKVTYLNNVNAGTAKVFIQGMNDYIGTVETKFKITKKSIASKTDVPSGFTASVNDGLPIYYSGYSVAPPVTVKDLSRSIEPQGGILVEGKDYTLKYKSNVDASYTAPVATVTGTGNYTGSFSVPFVIRPITYDAEHIRINVDRSVDYNRRVQTPAFTVVYRPNGYYTDPADCITLKPGNVYTLSYSDNMNAGSAGVTAVRKCKDDNVTNDSINSVDSSFIINVLDLSDAFVTAIPYQTYKNLYPALPKPTVRVNGVTLKEGKDYTLSYTNNDRRGNAIVTITAVDDNPNITGSKSVYFYIR